jgi:hypothetical protein
MFLYPLVVSEVIKGSQRQPCRGGRHAAERSFGARFEVDFASVIPWLHSPPRQQ